jgi:AcrR family transcriptional regulator
MTTTTPRSRKTPTARPRRRTRLSTDQVRTRLYEGALHRIRDQGYDSTSIAELTREAGVAKGTFFNHFPSKEHILAAWLMGVWEGSWEELRLGGLAGTEATRAQVEGFLRRLLEDRILAGAAVARMGDLPNIPPVGIRGWFLDRIRESLPVAVPLRAVKDEDLAALLFGALSETLREALLAPEAEKPRVLVGRLHARVDFLLASAGLPVG